MGEPSDESSVDRIHSWAKAHASSRNASPILNNGQRPSPASRSHSNNAPTTAHRPPQDGTSTSTGSTASPSKQAELNEQPHDASATRNIQDGSAPADNPALAPASNNTKVAGKGDPSLENGEAQNPPYPTRILNGSKRFVIHTKDALCHSKINLLLVFVPIGIAVNFAGLDPSIIFAMNAVAVVPLAGLLAQATETVASRLGDSLGALLNVTFGNAVELIIFIIALTKDEIRIVQASLIGSILSNLLLILGMAFLLGGLRFREQIYNNTITQMSACLLSLSVMSLLLPTAFHASFKQVADADNSTLKVSRGTSVILLFVYFLYLLFQLKSHAHLYQSMPQHMIDEESYPGVLADIMNSSSSDSDTSSSSSDTDSSSGSHGTARRIKKAFKNRRRRKSSASSKDASVPSSLISSPMTETSHHPGWGDNGSTGGTGSRDPKRRRGSVLNTVVSGDEADTEAEHNVALHLPRIRDFEGENPEGSKSPERKRKKHKHKRHKHHRQQSKSDFVEKTSPPPGSSTEDQGHPASTNPAFPSAHVDFANEAVVVAEPDNTTAKRGFIRPSLLPTRSLRPPLPSLLSNNVFVTPVNVPPPTTDQVSGPSSSRPALRRANSLPERLNEKAQTSAPTSLPPYTRGRNEARPPPPNDEEVEEPVMSRTAAVVMLLVSTGLVALCAEFLVDAIPEMVENSSVGEVFIGLIILPIVGNAAEHVTAVTVAAKNKMDLAIGVAVGSSIQIALFVTPLVVILGWIMAKEMTLYFTLFETISLFVTAFVVNFLVLDGRSNYLEGALLCSSYLIIAVAAFFYPDANGQSELGGSSTAER